MAARSRSAIRWACRGARIAGTAALELRERSERLALATMCIGVGQGIAIALERV